MIGGQAVIEGVMMKSDTHTAVSVRLNNGKIKTKKESIKKRSNIWKKPFFRGTLMLIDTLVIGIKALLWSADQQLEKHEKISNLEVVSTLVFSMALTVIFFVAVPYFAAGFFGVKEHSNPILFNLIDGMIKMALFLAYILAISYMKEVKRLFQNHGAEHMTVHCYEAGKKLTPENCKKYSTQHPRCGTSFLMIVLVISILLFSLIPLLAFRLFPILLTYSVWLQKAILLPIRILFIPLVASLSYELLKLSARFEKNRLMRLITWPGMAMQKITTKKPTEKQLEVAIKALEAVK